MKLILKDIPKLDSLFEGGESDENYERRRMTVEEDSYVLQGADQDITSIENWDKYGLFVCTDYLQVRDRILDIFDWNTATLSEIDIVISYFAYDKNVDAATNDANKVGYLMGQGLTLEEAQGFLVQAYAKFHTKERESCKSRSQSEKVSEVMLTFLSIPDASDFLHTVDGLLRFYSDEGVFGTAYGSAGVGILDYIESTPGTVYENTGLHTKGYEYNGGATSEMFVAALKDVLLNGNY